MPASQRAVTAYFQAVRAELSYSERSRQVLDVLARIRLPVPMAGISRELFLGAAMALLPEWARLLLRLSPRQRLQAGLGERALWAIAPLFRVALRDGVAARSCRRMGVSPEILRHW